MKGGFHLSTLLCFLSLLLGVIGQLTAHIGDIVGFFIDNGVIFGPRLVENWAFVIVLLTFPIIFLGSVSGLFAIGFCVAAIIKAIGRKYRRASVVIVVAIVGILLNSFIPIKAFIEIRDKPMKKEIKKIEENARKGDGEALAQLRKIVKKRLPWARHAAGILGEIYENGQGVPQDYNEAIRWYLRSGRGVFRACEMYDKGQGIPQDYVKAARCYRKAIFEGNFNNGAYQLGQLYEKGLGVIKDYEKAVLWYRAAASYGNEHAIMRLNDLGEQP